MNVPFDSNELNIKHLLSAQIDLPNGRIENIHFEDGGKKAFTNKVAPAKRHQDTKGRKRKRTNEDGGIEDLEGVELPFTWDRELQKNGRTAVVLFVDRASMEACFKAVKKLRKEQRQPVWGEGLKRELPGLGSASASRYVTEQVEHHC